MQRAVFFVRTGQPEQYRALDPEGALLALGYRSASLDVRRALLERMTALGDIDVLRVLAGQRSDRDDFASLSGLERFHLVEQLRARRDWDRLWSLVPLMPLYDAVHIAERLHDWRPSGRDDQRVFEALRTLSPGGVTAWLRDGPDIRDDAGPGSSPTRIPHTRIRLSDLDELNGLDFAPDGTQLAYAGSTRDRDRERGRAGIIDIGSSTVSHRYDLARSLGRLAHLGADTLVVADAQTGPVRRSLHLHCLAPDGARSLLGFEATEILALQRVADTRDLLLVARPGGRYPSRSTVSVGAFGGSLADWAFLDGTPDLHPQTATSDPEGRLIAVLGRNAAVVADRAGTTVSVLHMGRLRLRTVTMGAMSDAVLVRADETGSMDIWHEPLVSAQAPLSIDWPSAPRLVDLAWSPALNRFVATGSRFGPAVWFLDVPTTPGTPLPEDPFRTTVRLVGDRAPDRVRLSPRGDVLAVAYSSDPAPTIDLYCLPLLVLRSALSKPMGLMNHQALSDVAAALEHPALDGESRQMLDVLRTCLEHRFRHDVVIGETRDKATAGAYEIEIEPGEA